MTFTERRLPPPEPAGEAIPDGVRVTLLQWFVDHRVVDPTGLWKAFRQREGYGAFNEIAEDIRHRFGDDSANGFVVDMKAHFERERHRMGFAAGVDYNAEAYLRAVPAPQFLDALELAVAMAEYAKWQAVEEINRLFAKRGINYRFSDLGLAEWHGDQGAYQAIVQPALESLGDPRLAGAGSEFHSALRHLRAGSEKELEDAIEEAAKSVESVMKVLLQEHGVSLTGKETASPLFEALKKAGVVVAEVDNAVLGAARLRNAYGGHGTGRQPRKVPPAVPELTVRAAAAAIVYLAAMLP